MSNTDLGPLPEPDCYMPDIHSRHDPLEDGAPYFSEEKLRAERERCYALGVERERERLKARAVYLASEPRLDLAKLAKLFEFAPDETEGA